MVVWLGTGGVGSDDGSGVGSDDGCCDGSGGV